MAYREDFPNLIPRAAVQNSIIGNNNIQCRSHTELHSSEQVVGQAQHSEHTRIQDVPRQLSQAPALVSASVTPARTTGSLPRIEVLGKKLTTYFPGTVL